MKKITRLQIEEMKHRSVLDHMMRTLGMDGIAGRNYFDIEEEFMIRDKRSKEEIIISHTRLEEKEEEIDWLRKVIEKVLYGNSKI